MPSAVVLSASPTRIVAWTTPVRYRTRAIANPSPSEMPQPTTPSRAAAPRIRSKSISIPARKNRNASPKVESASMKLSVSARPSTCGPTMIPRKISTTTIGTLARRERSASTRCENRDRHDHEDVGVIDFQPPASLEVGAAA